MFAVTNQTIMENTYQFQIDVTTIEPRLKHPTIFKYFDELESGQTLRIENDHDPKPLYYQLLGERGNIFKWEYLENGPEIWTVHITKFEADKQEESIGQIAAKDLKKAQVFKKYGIDFCCGGKKTLADVCEEKGLDKVAIEKELMEVKKSEGSIALPFNEWSLDFLADYIVNTHHTYVKNNISDLNAFANKVYKVHGGSHPELARMFELVQMIKSELEVHLQKEEIILFPYIKSLVQKKDDLSRMAAFGTVQSPINVMEMEHESVGIAMAEIRTLSNNYSIPADACTTYKLYFELLEEFESDLHQHIHLENNILFPKAIELERKIKDEIIHQ